MTHPRLTKLHTRAWLLAANILAACAPAAAPPQPPAGPSPRTRPAKALVERRMRHEEQLSTPCGGTCVLEREGQSEVVLSLEAGGAIVARADGEKHDRLRSVAGDRAEHVRWHRSWGGRWRQRAGRLELELEPKEQACDHSLAEGSDSNSDSAAPCAPTKLHLLCSVRAIAVKKKEPERSWVCAPPAAAAPTTTLTPFPWVFGMSRPLLAYDRGPDHNPERVYVIAPETAATRSE